MRRVVAFLAAVVLVGFAALGSGGLRVGGPASSAGVPAVAARAPDASGSLPGAPGSGVSPPLPVGSGGPAPSGAAPSAAPATSAAPSASPPAGPRPSPGPPESAVPSAALDGLVARFAAAHHVPGLSATIRWPDGTTWTGTAGFADLGRRVPVRAGTAFAAASMSKTFTAALVLELVQEGRLGLDASAVRWLSPAVVKAARVAPGVTIRMLLDHTSGLYDFFFGPGVDAALQGAPSRAWSVARTLSFTRAPYFAPGTGWHYSNTNYLLLGLIAERVTGKPLAASLRERFLDPLGLRHTWYQGVERPRAPTAHGYRLAGPASAPRPVDLGDGTAIVPFTSVVTAAGGAGSLAATSADLATWAAALYGGRVLEPGSLAAMLGDVALTAGYRPRVPYGLGVESVRLGRFDTVGHNGRLLGFRGSMRYVPAAGVSIAVMSNQSAVDVNALVAALLDAAIPVQAPCRICR